MSQQRATIMAGVPARNMVLYHRIRFAVGDPAVLIELPRDHGNTSVLILRDIETVRTRGARSARGIAVAGRIVYGEKIPSCLPRPVAC